MNDDDQNEIDAYGEESIGGSSINPEAVTENSTEENADRVGWTHNIRKGENHEGTGIVGVRQEDN